MLRMLGGLLIMAGALWCGVSAVECLRRRARTLVELRASLVWLAEELTFRLTPLPKLLEHLSRDRQGSVGLFYQETLAGLGRDPEGGLRESWRRAMVLQLDFLKEDERQVLVEVGQTLGRYDAQAQAQVLNQAAGRLETIHAQAVEDARRLGRVYTSLSLAAGAALVLVLL